MILYLIKNMKKPFIYMLHYFNKNIYENNTNEIQNIVIK